MGKNKNKQTINEILKIIKNDNKHLITEIFKNLLVFFGEFKNKICIYY